MTAATQSDAVDVVTADARYGRLAYFRDDDPIGASLRLYGEWAQLELDVLLRFVRAGDTVVDVGANLGTHTVAFARAAGAAGRVIAFEPQARVFDLLERNVRSNGYDNVALYRLALGAEHSVRHVPALDYAAHVNVGAVSLLTRADGASCAVDMVSLDSFALDAVRLIKIDVEGMECDVLRGAAQTLQRCRPLLSVECNTVEAGAAVLAALRDAEYAFYVNRTPAYNPANHRANSMNRFGSSYESSVFCVPRELHGAVAAICAEQRTLSPVVTVDDVARVFLGGSRPDDADELTRLRYRVAKHGFELAEAERRAAGQADRIRELALSERAEADQRVAESEARLAQTEARLAGALADVADAAAGRADAEHGAASAETRADAARMRAENAERRADIVKSAVAEAHAAALAAANRVGQAEECVAQAEHRAGQAEEHAAQAEQRVTQAEERAAQAEQRAAQAEEHVRERDALVIAERQAAALGADQHAARTAVRVAQAEERAGQAEQLAAQAEEHAAQAEQRVAHAEERAAQAEQRAAQAAQCAAQAEEGLRERDALVDSFVRSRSWRITRPLRLLRHVFGPPDGVHPDRGAQG